MKKSLFLVLPMVFAFNITNVNALEIDEKLTLRFLRVSSTKKTVLVNRGGEDGLVVGDHAKFFITAGVVARGVVEKVSPSRSVWSLYRIVDPEEITQDKVLNLKIATPVKITADPTKSLKEEPIPGGSESMSLEEGAQVGAVKGDTSDAEVVINDQDKDELKGLGIEEDEEKSVASPVKSKGAAKASTKKSTPKNVSVVEDAPVAYSTNTSKSWEVWGMIYVNALSGTVDNGSTESTTSTSTTASSVDFSGGIEKYFMNYNNFLKEFSVSLFLHKRSLDGGDSVKTEIDWTEYGVGASYHFYHSSSSLNRLVGFATANFGQGKANIQTKTVVNGADVAGDPESGTSTFFSVGAGMKYVLSNGFGIRAILDYYSSTETYSFTDSTTTRTLSGPRVNFGLSYRF
jgi:hypothetical protein